MLAQLLLPSHQERRTDSARPSEIPADHALHEEHAALAYLRALWAVRILRRKPVLFRSSHGFADEEAVLDLTGLPADLIGERSLERIDATLRARLSELEGSPVPLSGPVFDNTEALTRMLQLSPAEAAVLLFSVLRQGDEAFDSLLDAIGNVNQRELVLVLANALRVPAREITRALRRDGILGRSGLLEIDGHRFARAGRKLKLLDGLADELGSGPDGIEERLFQRYFLAAPPGTLSAADFGYIELEWRTIELLLRDALSQRRPGVNVLLHGAPGVGKTELVRAMGSALGAAVFEISNDEDRGTNRLRLYNLAQEVLQRRAECVVLFDEVEDAFPAASRHVFQTGRDSGRDKAWTNRLLETNPVPAIWVTNAVDAIDPAFIRRFDHVAEIKPPPGPVRTRLLREMVRGLDLGDDWVRRIGGNGPLAPAEMCRAARLARLAAAGGAAPAGEVFEHTVGNTQRAMGFQWRRPVRAVNDVGGFDYSLVNSDSDLKAVTGGLARARAGRLVLYGPPGTGKSLYARHLAARLDQPLVCRKASELLSMWVGGTEQLIAAMFEEARDEKAVLLLDEADSFLRDRRAARQHWEITQVNELLTRMEDFEGVFVCATNLFEELDPAVLRRFDLKVRLNWLSIDQAWRLCARTAESLGIPEEPASSLAPVRRRLERLTNLAPGDFAAVARGSRLSGQVRTWEGLVTLLEQEAAMKPGGARRKPGFIDR